MSFFRNVWTDLVEKKLWPVAIVLLLALVAVPFAFGSSSDSAAPPVTGASGATGPQTDVAQIGLAPSVPVRLDRSGKTRNPFAQQHVPRAEGTSGTSGAAGSSASGTTGDGGKASGATGGGGSTSTDTTTTSTGTTTAPTQPTEPVKPKIVQEAFTVVLTLKRAGQPTVSREIGRLTPLPAAANPFFVYLGVLEDRRTAVFLLSSDVTAKGEGTCRPKGTECQTVELQAGDKEVFDVAGDDGKSIAQYTLQLVRVERDGVSTSAQAATSKSKSAVAKRAATRAGARQAAGTGSRNLRLRPLHGAAQASPGERGVDKDKRSVLRRATIHALALGAALEGGVPQKDAGGSAWAMVVGAVS